MLRLTCGGCDLIAKWCLSLETSCSPSGSSVHGISQARILEWVVISYSRGSSWLRHWTCGSCTGSRILYHWATREALQITLLLFSHPVVSDSLWPHGLQHAWPPCPSPSPEICPSSCPLHWWCLPATSSSINIYTLKYLKKEHRQGAMYGIPQKILLTTLTPQLGRASSKDQILIYVHLHLVAVCLQQTLGCNYTATENKY